MSGFYNKPCFSVFYQIINTSPSICDDDGLFHCHCFIYNQTPWFKMRRQYKNIGCKISLEKSIILKPASITNFLILVDYFFNFLSQFTIACNQECNIILAKLLKCINKIKNSFITNQSSCIHKNNMIIMDPILLPSIFSISYRITRETFLHIS